jgi:MarR family transcriptional regulator, transcriptional regulator for hemolysin
MPLANPRREFAFLVHDVARLLKTYADQKARQYGMTRAQWAVLVRLQRTEGLKQSELAEILDLQPITLTRLLDRLCANGLIERRADPDDRRANRLFLTPAAGPVVESLGRLGEELMTTVLEGIDLDTVELMLGELGIAKDNLRKAIARNAAPEPTLEQTYG